MLKQKKKKTIIRVLVICLALLMPLSTVLVTFARAEEVMIPERNSNESKYDSLDINVLTGHGEEPEELSVSAGAAYQEKAWYEYVSYAEHAVCSYRIDDDSRLLFYDPYTYTNAMIMDVKFDATTTEFDTMSSYSISHTTGKTMQACTEATYTNTQATQESGRDKTGTEIKNGGKIKTSYNHDESTNTKGSVSHETYYNYTEKDTTTIGETITIAAESPSFTSPIGKAAVDSATSISKSSGWYTDKVTDKTVYSDDYKTTTTYSGESTAEDNTYSSTEGWTELSNRVTTTLGSSSSTSTSWAEEESTTVTKTYAATHFATDGVTPLPWAIVHYQVQMPMKCCLQIKHSGEWITISTVYTILTTVQGTCRAWMQNGQVYYEDWGNGEPVVATDFWAQFMTREQLISAYSNKLYPVGGVN